MAETVKNIAVLEKALHIMEFLLAYPKGVQLNEISIGVGLNKSTVYRILHTLRLHNYVIQDEKDSSYSLGNRFLHVQQVALAAEEQLRHLAERLEAQLG